MTESAAACDSFQMTYSRNHVTNSQQRNSLIQFKIQKHFIAIRNIYTTVI